MSLTRDQRIIATMPIAEAVARRLGLRGADADDALSVAFAALVVAADKFDPIVSPTGAAGWEPFAAQRVKWALADWARDRLGTRRKHKGPTLLGDTDPGADARAADPADLADAADRRPCPKCERLLGPGQFYERGGGRVGLASWCRGCVRVLSRQLRRTAAYRRWLTAHLARPDVRARRAAADRKRAADRKPRQKAYRATARAKLLHCRRQARVKLRQTTDPTRRAALESLIARYTTEIDGLARRAERAGAA